MVVFGVSVAADWLTIVSSNSGFPLLLFLVVHLS